MLQPKPVNHKVLKGVTKVRPKFVQLLSTLETRSVTLRLVLLNSTVQY